MKTKKYERAKRTILSSLLRSDLTMNEIKEIGEAFVNESDFSRDIGWLIKDLVMKIDESIHFAYTKQLMPHHEMDSHKLDEAMFLIKKRRILKKEIISILTVLCPDMKKYFRAQKRTVREIVRFFFKKAPIVKIDEFIDWLYKGRSSSDAYLKGIMQRR